MDWPEIRFVQKSRALSGWWSGRLYPVGESVGIPPTSHHCSTSLLHNPAMMSSNRNMHCLSLRTQVQLSSARQWSTHTYIYTHSFMFMGLYKACRHSQSHSCKNTPKHTHYPTHKHMSNVSKSPERLALLVCKLPAFQGKTWPFTSILVFACTNCRAVQTLPGRWCLKAHSVSQCVQVILPKLLTRLVREGSVAREVKQEFYHTKINFLRFFIVCGISWCGLCTRMMAR